MPPPIKSPTNAIIDRFDYQPRTRIVFGVHAIEQLGDLARATGAKRFLVVTDAGVAKAGHADRTRHALEIADIEAVLYDQAKENPNTSDVAACVAVAREEKVDGIVGLGGGSAMDTAKAANILLTNGGRMQDYWGYGKLSKPTLPLLAVPTTAGTGSECQSYALISDEETHQKMACGDPAVAAAVALLDPALTLSQPPQVTANTGMDALVHAVETAVTRRRNALSWLYSKESFRLIIETFPRVMRSPEDLNARAQMQLGAAYAGLAIELSMLGAAHSAANPLTARFGVIHGQAVGMMLPHVVRYNAQSAKTAEIYRDLMASAGLSEHGAAPAEASEALAVRLEELLAAAGLPTSPSERGVGSDDIPQLAAEAAKQWTAQFNPRAVSADDFEAIYEAATPGEAP